MSEAKTTILSEVGDYIKIVAIGSSLLIAGLMLAPIIITLRILRREGYP